jgi:hypothetical protein
MLLEPFSDNIIFMDGEFSTLDSKVGEMISIGLVKSTGEELYLEIDFKGPVSDWVEEHVIPNLSKEKISKDEATQKIWKFVGNSRPYIVAYVNQFDAIYWYRMFGSPKDHPAFWIPIDFASILFANNFDPESFNNTHFFEELGVDKSKYKLHNALEDAKLLADVYKKFFVHLEKLNKQK